MHAFDLTDEERETLAQFLEHSLRSKRVEIHRTEATAFRNELEHQETILQGILDKLQQAAHVDSP